MPEYNTTLEPAGSDYERDTATCPICSGTVREMRNGDKWLCDDCARYWDLADLEV